MGIPEYINMLEDAQKKAKHANLPTIIITLVLVATKSLLQAHTFSTKTKEWEKFELF